MAGSAILPRPYRPIDCSFHDRLEAAAVKGRPARLVIRSPDGSPVEVEDRIRTLEAREGVEYLLTEGGLRVRLDDLLSLDGVVPGA
jgi:Rho-binding antiterminator